MTAARIDGRAVRAPAHASDRWAIGIIVGAVIGGALLRIAMAQGDLWLDEVWSLTLVQPLTSAVDVFTGLSHDNNHFLNSLWLFWLGPDRAPWAYRVPAVALGALSVVLAAWVVWPRSPAGAAAAAVFTATSMPLVVYGSEARGYAGLIAAILLAIAAFDRALDPGTEAADRRKARWLFGAAVGIGTLFHLTMVFTVAVLAAAAFLHFAARERLAQAVDSTLAALRPALLGLVPAATAIVGGILRKDGFATGNTSPATLAAFMHGYGDQIRFTIGASAAIPTPVCIATAGLLTVAALRTGRLSITGATTLVGAVFVLPGTMLFLHLPNLEFARYYTVTGLALLLAAALLAGALWDGGRTGPRCAAVTLVACFAAAQLAADAAALRDGRGRYGEALAGMTDAQGRVRYATPAPFWVDAVAATSARRMGLTTLRVTDADFCGSPPDWLVDVPETDADRTRATIVAGPTKCRATFALNRTVAANPLSGMPWMIYRRAEDSGRTALNFPLP